MDTTVAIRYRRVVDVPAGVSLGADLGADASESRWMATNKQLPTGPGSMSCQSRESRTSGANVLQRATHCDEVPEEGCAQNRTVWSLEWYTRVDSTAAAVLGVDGTRLDALAPRGIAVFPRRQQHRQASDARRKSLGLWPAPTAALHLSEIRLPHTCDRPHCMSIKGARRARIPIGRSSLERLMAGSHEQRGRRNSALHCNTNWRPEEPCSKARKIGT